LNRKKPMQPEILREITHRRFNPLTREWVLVSPHRARRPWLGQVEKAPPENLPAYDPTCYLCPGNERAAGRRNPPYTGTFVFDNDFAALLRPEQMAAVPAAAAPAGAAPAGGESLDSSPIFRLQVETGTCQVVCFSPRHDLTLPEMPVEGVEEVLRTWTHQTVALGALEHIAYVQVFENKGAMMGCSNPHPHSQIWATSHVPNEPEQEIASQAAYLQEHKSCLVCDTLAAEANAAERIVLRNAHFTALVPFWAIWPFEILLISHRHAASLPDLSPEELADLADMLRQVTIRYDNLFEISFPYSMGFHQAPTDGHLHPECHLHAHFYPPLLRSATVRKFMVGFEMLGMPQRDLTAESAAERLRALSATHFRGARRDQPD
jgi:UDPglucose--hexose-1-phosphate uridylyltransferase